MGESRRKLGAGGAAAEHAARACVARNGGLIGASLLAAMIRKIPLISLSCVLAALFAGAADLSAAPASLISASAVQTAPQGKHAKKHSRKHGRKHGKRKHPKRPPGAPQT